MPLRDKRPGPYPFINRAQMPRLMDSYTALVHGWGPKTNYSTSFVRIAHNHSSLDTPESGSWKSQKLKGISQKGPRYTPSGFTNKQCRDMPYPFPAKISWLPGMSEIESPTISPESLVNTKEPPYLRLRVLYKQSIRQGPSKSRRD